MRDVLNKSGVAIFAALVVASVFAGTGVAATLAPADSVNGSQAQNAQAVTVQEGSAKAMTLPWYRNSDAGNGPYPGIPTEDGGNAIELFTKAEGDGIFGGDNSTARNPGGNWDMIVLHVETSGLSELNPPNGSAKKGLVTEEFVSNSNWNLNITQTNGAKTLSVAENQQNFEAAPVNTSYPLPPVMVFADTGEAVESENTIDGEPDSGLYVWIDPNRAKLSKGGETVSFDTGETYNATFEIHGQTESTTFSTVEGTASLNASYNPANTFGATIKGTSTLAHSTEMKMVLEFENGETREQTVEVQGNRVTLPNGEVPGTVPRGTVEAAFDLSGMENKQFTVKLYAPGPVRNDDEYLNESNRVLVAESSGTVRDFIDPNYEIENASVAGAKPLTVPIGEDYRSASAIAGTVGDGELSYDTTIAKAANAVTNFQPLLLHFETSSSVFEAIRKSPGRTPVEKFANSPLSLSFVQQNADGAPKRLNLAKNESGVSIVLDKEMLDERIYTNKSQGIIFAINPNEAVVYKDGQPTSIEVGENYTAQLTIETTQGNRTASTEQISFIEGETWFKPKGEPVELGQSSSTQLVFNTELAAAFEWSIEINAVGHNFSKTVDAVPVGSGAVRAGKIAGSNPVASSTISLDTSQIPVGTQLNIVANISEGPENAPVTVLETTGSIVPPPSANVTLNAMSGDGQSLTISQLGLSDGGFVSVHTGGPTGPTVGTSDYLEEGTYSGLQVSLDQPLSETSTVYVVVHQDTNNNGQYDFPNADDPYLSDGSAVIASAEYTVSTPTATATATPTADGGDATPTATPASGSTETPTDEPAAETTSDSGPGFGAAAALVALLGAALVARRRVR